MPELEPIGTGPAEARATPPATARAPSPSTSTALSASASAQPGDATDPAEVACSHCGLPVPAVLIDVESPTQFCCGGCRQVYALLHECGLERYYAYRDAAEAPPQRALTSGRDYGELDTDDFRALYCRPGPEGTLRIEL